MASIVIVGGGVIGCAIAERLSRDRHRVLLLERDRIGAHASGAAAGLLSPRAETDGDLGRQSLQMFPDLVARIERASGVGVEFRRVETLTPAVTLAEERALRRGSGRWLNAEEIRAAEPWLGTRIRGAIVRDDAQLTPPRLVLALARTAVAQGAEIREGAPVSGLALRSGRLLGVHGPDGVIRADAVVLAAGPWSSSLTSPAGVALDVRPNRGQLVVLRAPGSGLRRVLMWRGSYLVPKPDGTIVVGGTEEDAGFEAIATAEGVLGLLDFAVRAMPALVGASIERTFAGLRPATSDGKPVIGSAPSLAGLVIACGHNRNGILLSPVTADIVRGAVAR